MKGNPTTPPNPSMMNDLSDEVAKPVKGASRKLDGYITSSTDNYDKEIKYEGNRRAGSPGHVGGMP